MASLSSIVPISLVSGKRTREEEDLTWLVYKESKILVPYTFSGKKNERLLEFIIKIGFHKSNTCIVCCQDVSSTNRNGGARMCPADKQTFLKATKTTGTNVPKHLS